MASSRRTHEPSSASSSSPALADVAGTAPTASILPPLAALFLVSFDVRAGYTVVWKRAVDAALAEQLEGLVEYKSLPSGLHAVPRDLVYFVHDGRHAGLSAFANEPTDDEGLRSARMVAVGILVPLSHGRLGRAWRHAGNLDDMAAKLAAKAASPDELLQQYWDRHRASVDAGPASPAPSLPTSPAQYRQAPGRRRSATADGAASSTGPQHELSAYHPAWSLAAMLDTFGPLIFPIYRAALLRKRILISCHAPVRQMCDFVYNLSVLSNIPLSIANNLPPTASTRLRPLFTIGVHDIPFLVKDHEAATRRSLNQDTDDESGSGWIACTTDSILAVKDTLWDMLVTMPPQHDETNRREKAWPSVECPRGVPVKATQRDLRRFNALCTGLSQLAASAAREEHARRPDSHASSSDRSPVRLHSARLLVALDDPEEVMGPIVEPSSWSALAYNGFMWWASAGEQMRSDEREESARDAALLADLGRGPSMHRGHSSSSSPPPPPRSSRAEVMLSDSIASLTRHDASSTGDGDATIELAIVAYFHRLTTQMVSVLADIVDGVDGDETCLSEDGDGDGDGYYTDASGDDENETLLPDGRGDGADIAEEGQRWRRRRRRRRHDDDDEEEDEEEDRLGGVVIDSHAVESMGLDVWSAADAGFARDLARRYFGRDATVETKGVDVCGVRVC